MNYLRKPLWGDVLYLSDNLRERDVEEVQSAGLTPFGALSQGLTLSNPCYTLVLPSGEPGGMIGVTDGFYDGLGAIWMLGAKNIEQCPMTVLKNSRKVLDILWSETSYTGFYNYVYSQNQLHIDWLNWLGFSFLRTVKFGPYNRDFIEFVKLRG